MLGTRDQARQIYEALWSGLENHCFMHHAALRIAWLAIIGSGLYWWSTKDGNAEIHINSAILGAIGCLLALAVVPQLRSLLTVVERALLWQKPKRYGLDHLWLNLPVDPPQWMNLGDWRAARTTGSFQDACQAALLGVLEAVDIKQGETVVDVGFGCGDQDLHILKAYKPFKIIGYNASEDQVRAAQERVAKLGESRFEPKFGIAPFLPILSDSTDVVLSIDSAYHYDTRQEFVRRSFTWLRRGGRFGSLDLVLKKAPSRSEWALILIFSKITGIPTSNLYDSERYKEIMIKEGYTDVREKRLDETAFLDLSKFISEHLKRYEYILSPGLVSKYRMTAKIMEFLGKRGLFHLSVFSGKKA